MFCRLHAVTLEAQLVAILAGPLIAILATLIVTMPSLIHLEVLVKPNVNLEQDEPQLRSKVIEWLQSDLTQLRKYLKLTHLTNGHHVMHDLPSHLLDQLENVSLNLDSHSDDHLHLMNHTEQEKAYPDLKIECYFYKLFDEIMQNNFEEDMPATFHTLLPSRNLVGLWESLIFDTNIQLKLLNYVTTSLLFASQNVNPAIITWNKVILLHGPPGTGKTSLCKALAQKFSVRLYTRYQNFQLIEINSHSLFSKWFSESGKLVLKLFDGIREFAEDNSNLIFVLIDEVESLAYDRQRSNSTDPSDAIRVVNALLTQIDSIRRYPNVIILASSNVTEAMDNAFVDRADIKQYIGLPAECSIYKIHHNCIQELLHSNVLVDSGNEDILSFYELKLAENTNEASQSAQLANSHLLLDIVKKSVNLSGRTLRKLPFLAIALFSEIVLPISIKQYLIYLDKAVEKQLEDNKYFNV